jgi:hypothetical protein
MEGNYRKELKADFAVDNQTSTKIIAYMTLIANDWRRMRFSAFGAFLSHTNMSYLEHTPTPRTNTNEETDFQKIKGHCYIQPSLVVPPLQVLNHGEDSVLICMNSSCSQRCSSHGHDGAMSSPWMVQCPGLSAPLSYAWFIYILSSPCHDGAVVQWKLKGRFCMILDSLNQSLNSLQRGHRRFIFVR